jgi:hypothetical protein
LIRALEPEPDAGQSPGAIEPRIRIRHTARPVSNEDLGRDIHAGVVEYASVADRASRMSTRARVLGWIDKLKLEPKPLRTELVGERRLQEDQGLRGAVVMHLDLASRSAPTSSELLFTAATGRVAIAVHPDLPEFPVGVALLLPCEGLPKGRRSLFSDQGTSWDVASVCALYALATNPGGLGAGRSLLEVCRRETRRDQRFVAYAPLTGLRARIIQLVDDPDAWQEGTGALSGAERDELARQLADLLARTTLPDLLDEPALSFLAAEARTFADSPSYSVGRFHRHMGATLVGIDDGGDPSDCDAMWSRAYFEYA